MIDIQPSIILSLVALISALPNLIKFATYYLYQPKIEAFFPSPNRSPNGLDKVRWSELKRTPLNIRHKNLRSLTIEVEYISNNFLDLRRDLGKTIIESGLTGGYPLKSGFRYKTESFPIGGNSLLALTFPFEPYSEECSLEVVIHPTIPLSEFGFPRYFGHVELKPIKKAFKITA